MSSRFIPLFAISSCLYLDAIIHSRIINDEKALKKVVKRFHNYASVAYPLTPATASTSTAVIDDARENFLIELAALHLSLKKSVLVCEAEARQVEEYEKERQKIGIVVRHILVLHSLTLQAANDRDSLKGQIEQLKTSLEDAQLLRKRKLEYDQVAEKINALASREELQLCVSTGLDIHFCSRVSQVNRRVRERHGSYSFGT